MNTLNRLRKPLFRYRGRDQGACAGHQVSGLNDGRSYRHSSLEADLSLACCCAQLSVTLLSAQTAHQRGSLSLTGLVPEYLGIVKTQFPLAHRSLVEAGIWTTSVFAGSQEIRRGVRQRSPGNFLYGEAASRLRFHARVGHSNSHPPHSTRREKWGTRSDFPRGTLVKCSVPTPQR